jgi:deoxyribonuclease-4
MADRKIIRLGVHTSIAGGLHLSLERAHALGCTTMQIFSHNPRGWALKPISEEEEALFRRRAFELDISPVYVHVSYLLNIASSDAVLRKRSVEMLIQEMLRADAIGAGYVVLHTGTAHDSDGRNRAVESLTEVFERGPYNAGLLLENTSGKRGDIASSIEELAWLHEGAGGRPAGVCIDTCHAFAAGYDFTARGEVKRIAGECTRLLGSDAVRLVHLNDSKGAAGSGTDRHEHIGRGLIGAEALQTLLRHPVFLGVPVVLETPKHSEEDDPMNLASARSLLSR